MGYLLVYLLFSHIALQGASDGQTTPYTGVLSSLFFSVLLFNNVVHAGSKDEKAPPTSV